LVPVVQIPIHQILILLDRQDLIHRWKVVLLLLLDLLLLVVVTVVFITKMVPLEILEDLVEVVEPQEALVVVSEHLVVGTTLGMRDKYQRACTDFAQAIANVVR
jgi:hypothetical protein